jgi:hypothetical protein
MKTAEQLLTELLRHARPPRGVPIVLTEDAPPNWIAGIGVVPLDVLSRYNEKHGALRESDPQVDWSGVAERVGERRRIARWLSEVL